MFPLVSEFFLFSLFINQEVNAKIFVFICKDRIKRFCLPKLTEACHTFENSIRIFKPSFRREKKIGFLSFFFSLENEVDFVILPFFKSY